MSNYSGLQILDNPSLNQSTHFPLAEREKLHLTGLLPNKEESLEMQMERVKRQIEAKGTNYERYIYLMSLLDRNETLFYRIIMSNPAYFLPMIYNPTIGEACLKFDIELRRPHGMYLSMTQKGHLQKILTNWPQKDVRFICITNGGRVLGLGDLGINGMNIPIGKLLLYTIAAAVPPKYLLPMHIDTGTNNTSLLEDPLYLGIRQRRLGTEELFVLMDEFMEAVHNVFPLCCVHFEDWTGRDAIRLLERYRDKICCFNDDIQGTAAIVVTGLLNAMKIKKEKLSQQKVLILGAGSAAIGIADFVASILVEEGLSRAEALAHIHLFDSKGLIEASRQNVQDFQQPYAHPSQPAKSFLEAVHNIKPTAIIGVSTVGGAFTQEVVEAMTSYNTRPIIFALSNPTAHAECTAEQAYHWSHGKAIFAAGVQFAPVSYNGQTYRPGQANNLYIFPAVGMAALATQASRLTDAIFVEAAQAIADEVSTEQLSHGQLYPHQSDLLHLELRAAGKIAKAIFDHNLARIPRPSSIHDLIQSYVYTPQYQDLAARCCQNKTAPLCSS